MCGIAGIVSPRPEHLRRIVAMNLAQAHRGPDGSGHLLLGDSARVAADTLPTGQPGDVLALGHRRLAIVDTSEAGLQPMGSADGRDWISYNGEVYNHLELRRELEALGHRFRSHSDTEVILAAWRQWGSGCFARFNGMWAIALWDGTARRLVLSRDRLGVKPLCWARQGDTLLFASEAKALFATGLVAPRLRAEAAFDFLRWSMVDHEDDGFFAGVHSLPPGHWAQIDPARPDVRPQAYWQLDPQASLPVARREEAVEAFGALFEDAVRLRLRSDVPVGSCLSGGLDSSAIVCQAQALRTPQDGPFHTFHAASDDPRFDERRWAELVHRHTGSALHLSFPDADGFLAELDDLVWHQEAPFTTTSIYAQWLVMKAARQQRIPVLLDGQGADEILCGYRKFHLFHLRDLRRQRRWGALLRAGWQLARHGDRSLWRWREGTRYLPRRWRERIPSLAEALQPAARAAWEASDPGLSAAGTLAARQVQDLTRFSVPSLLRYEDRNSMAWSIESRVPFLDYRLVEMMVALPAELKIHGGRTKAVLREALRPLVPAPILDRRDKMGFVTPQQVWMRGALGAQIEAALTHSDFAFAHWFDPARVRAAWRRDAAGARLPDGDVLRMFLLDRWARRFGVAL